MAVATAEVAVAVATAEVAVATAEEVMVALEVAEEVVVTAEDVVEGALEEVAMEVASVKEAVTVEEVAGAEVPMKAADHPVVDTEPTLTTNKLFPLIRHIHVWISYLAAKRDINVEYIMR